MVRVAKRNSSDAAGLVVVVVTVKRRVISRSSLDASSRLEVIQTPPSGPRWPRRYPWRLRLGSSRGTLVRTPQGHWRTGWTDRRQAQVSLACRPVPRQLPAGTGASVPWASLRHASRWLVPYAFGSSKAPRNTTRSVDAILYVGPQLCPGVDSRRSAHSYLPAPPSSPSATWPASSCPGPPSSRRPARCDSRLAYRVDCPLPPSLLPKA